MSDENTNKAPADPTFGGRLEITAGGLGAASADLGGEAPEVVQKDTDGYHADIGDAAEGEAPKADANDTAPKEPAKEGEAEPAKEDEAEAPTEPEAPEAPLPAFEADKPEVMEAFDAKYFSAPDPDGGEGKVLNLSAFNPELEENLKSGKAELNPDTYSYLKAKLGISKDAVNAHVAAVVQQAKAQVDALDAVLGGPGSWETSKTWAEANYTPAQKAAFNLAQEEGGEAWQEALSLLRDKHAKATGGKATVVAPKPAPAPTKEARAASPKVNATAGASSAPTGVAGYPDFNTYRKALKEAGGDDAKRAEVNRRGKASPWWSKA